MRQIGADLRQLLIVAAVTPERLHRLRTAEPERYVWVAPEHWAEVVDTIRAKPVEMVVVDPLFSGEPRTHEIERLRVLFPSLPLMVYTALSPHTAGVLLHLGRAGIRRALFHRCDDAPAAIRGAIRAELEQSASQQVMQALASALQGLPSQIQWALESTLAAGGDDPTVSALAERAQLKRRTCERWFAKLGLPSPKMVMVLARVLYAHRLLLDPGYTVEDVALKLGYSKAKTLQMHLREVFGLTAGDLRISLSADEALALVTRQYFPRFAQAAS